MGPRTCPREGGGSRGRQQQRLCRRAAFYSVVKQPRAFSARTL